MTILPYQVAQSADDGYEKPTGVVVIDGNSTGLLDTANYWALFRFSGISLPQGAGGSVVAAFLSFYVFATAGDDLVADFYGEAADNAAVISVVDYNISSRARTTALTSVNTTGIAAGGSTWYDVDVTAQLREIVNRPGWASGNAAAFILDAQLGISFNTRNWDYGSGTGPKLTVVYEAASMPRVVHHLREQGIS